MESINKITFKIYFSNENIRRFNVEKRPTFEEFVGLLVKLYSPTYHPELRMQYVDTEKDKIDITCELEWEEMFAELSKERIIKIFIKEGKEGAYFKDGPEPQPMYFYSEIDKKPVVVEEDLSRRIPQCLAKFFPGQKILPHNLPSFLCDIVSVKNLQNNEVELDVDIPKLKDMLHRTAMSLLDKAEFSKALEYLEGLFVLDPNDPVTLYNLACAHSLLNNVNDALNLLNQAVELGYKNVEHMLQDKDFLNIRETEGFYKIVEKIRQMAEFFVPEPEPEIKTPEPEPEIKNPEPEVKIVPQPVEEIKVVPEIKPKEPKPEPVPEVKKSPQVLKWEAQLNLLADMGFLVHDELIPLLEKYKGNVEQVIASLL